MPPTPSQPPYSHDSTVHPLPLWLEPYRRSLVITLIVAFSLIVVATIGMTAVAAFFATDRWVVTQIPTRTHNNNTNNNINTNTNTNSNTYTNTDTGCNLTPSLLYTYSNPSLSSFLTFLLAWLVRLCSNDDAIDSLNDPMKLPAPALSPQYFLGVPFRGSFH